MRRSGFHGRSLGALWLLISLAGVGAMLGPFGGSRKTPTQAASHSTGVVDSPASAAASRTGVPTEAIESIRVGQRVLGRNPEVSDDERDAWQEPDWAQWLHVTLVMPMQSVEHGLLHIELLRPESWIRERLEYVVEDPGESEEALPSVLSGAEADAESFAKIRPLAQDLLFASALAELRGQQLNGLMIGLDLPEIGAVGAAMVVDIQAATGIEPGEGQVVTATLAHPPATQVLDVTLDGADEPIGVTDNHPFWSVDRQEFVAVGEMEIGERVLTYHGDTQRIASKLPRPGPETVYNLEVYGEHVYFVGDDGFLVHNQYLKGIIGGRGKQKFKDWWDQVSLSKLNALWKDPNKREAVKDAARRLRRGGRDHEWYMVKNLPLMKKWGVTAEQLVGMQQSIKQIDRQLKTLTHAGSKGAILHKKLDDMIQASTSLREFAVKLQAFARKEFVNGVDDLPALFRNLDDL